MLKINTKVIKIHLVGPKIHKTKKFLVWKKWKKCLVKEHEIFQVKVGTLQMNPILEDIQIGHKTRTEQTKNLFEGVNNFVFWDSKMKKRPQPQSIYIFGAMVQSLNIFGYCLNLWPCFWTFCEPLTWISRFWAFFCNVFRCLIHLNHENKGLPLNIFTF